MEIVMEHEQVALRDLKTARRIVKKMRDDPKKATEHLVTTLAKTRRAERKAFENMMEAAFRAENVVDFFTKLEIALDKRSGIHPSCDQQGRVSL